MIEELIALGMPRRRPLRAAVRRRTSGRSSSGGRERIARELSRRGIVARADRAALADDRRAEDSELERAVAVIERRFAGELRDRRQRERALGVLLRKGYDSELALEARPASPPAR